MKESRLFCFSTVGHERIYVFWFPSVAKDANRFASFVWQLLGTENANLSISKRWKSWIFLARCLRSIVFCFNNSWGQNLHESTSFVNHRRKKIRIFLSTCLRSNVFCLTILREQETRIFWFPSIRISKRESILSKPFLTFQHLLFTKLLGSENVNLSLPSMKKEKKVKLQQAYQTHPLKIH